MYIRDDNKQGESSKLHRRIRDLGGITGLGWTVYRTKPPKLPQGHELLTRIAARSLQLSDSELNTIVEANRQVDLENPTEIFSPEEQKRHALRRDLCQPISQARADIVAHLYGLYKAILQAPLRADKLSKIGETLHLIQDSYSPAHVERMLPLKKNGPAMIIYIRNYGRGLMAPAEHGFKDDRDIITTSDGLLTRWAEFAVHASREWLEMMVRHLSKPTDPKNPQELGAYIKKHFSLALSVIEPRESYKSCS